MDYYYYPSSNLAIYISIAAIVLNVIALLIRIIDPVISLPTSNSTPKWLIRMKKRLGLKKWQHYDDEEIRDN